MEKKGKSMVNSGENGAGLHRHAHGPGSFPRSASISGRFSPLDKISDPKTHKPVPLTRPKTQHELLNRDLPAFERTPWLNLEKSSHFTEKASPAKSATGKSSAKLLVNVTVAQSIGALRVLVATDATVVDVIKATLASYAKEGRRPILSSDPLSFGLHYSQFTIDCLNPNDKMKDLGSRNFFMCAKTGSTR